MTPSQHWIAEYAKLTGCWVAFVFLRTMFGYERICRLVLTREVEKMNAGMDLKHDFMLPAYYERSRLSRPQSYSKLDQTTGTKRD